MTQFSDLVITGVTGRLGGRVARRLAAHSAPLRMIARDPSLAPHLPGVKVAQAAYRDRDAAMTAIDGAQTLFMVSAAESLDRLADHKTFIDAAIKAGVRHIVYLSSIAAAAGVTFTLGRDHWETEQYIRASGMDFTFLRDNMYADFLPSLVGNDGVLRGPADNGRIAAVAQDDVADAATAVLLDPSSHINTTYGLTGPAALTLAEVAATITRVTGRPTMYHPETVEEAYTSRSIYGAPKWQVDAWVSSYIGVARGEFEVVTDAIRTLTGHEPMSFEDVLMA